MLTTGWIGHKPSSSLYTNNGQGSFVYVPGTSFNGVTNSSIAFTDVDDDNDQDVLITGWIGSAPISKLYTNNGQGHFSPVPGTPFEAVSSRGSIAFADVDGDSDQDVLITGTNIDGDRSSKLYTNNGQGHFTEVVGAPFEAVSQSSIAFADIDGDNDQDVLITGSSPSGPISKLYLNNSPLSSSSDITNTLSLDFALYPNPAKATCLNIHYYSKGYRLVALSIFDLNNRLLSQQERRTRIGDNIISINISSLTEGSYIIQLKDGKRMGSRKVLIK